MVNVLIVEDNENILELETQVMENEGHNVKSARDGMEAIEMLEKFIPDIAIVDMMMPEMSGIEFCKKLRADPRSNKSKIIFVTALKMTDIWGDNPQITKKNNKDKNIENMRKNLDDIKKLGVENYLEKPFDIKDLVRVVNQTLNK